MKREKKTPRNVNFLTNLIFVRFYLTFVIYKASEIHIFQTFYKDIKSLQSQNLGLKLQFSCHYFWNCLASTSSMPVKSIKRRLFLAPMHCLLLSILPAKRTFRKNLMGTYHAPVCLKVKKKYSGRIAVLSEVSISHNFKVNKLKGVYLKKVSALLKCEDLSSFWWCIKSRLCMS